MSGYPSRDSYYRSHSNSSSWPQTSRSERERESLPPLRSVLGQELDMVAKSSGTQRPDYSQPYDLNDMRRALPPSSRPPTTSYEDSRRSDSHYSQGSPSGLTRSNSYGDQTFGHGSAHGPEATGRWYRGSESRKDRSPNRKYACNWPGCEKRFERQNALDTHMNIHTQTKPFICPVPNCGKAFNVLSNMRRHVAATHKEYRGEGESTSDEYEYSQHGRSKAGYAYPGRDGVPPPAGSSTGYHRF